MAERLGCDKRKIHEQEEDLGSFLERAKEDKGYAADIPEDDDDTKILKEVSLQDFVPAATIERQLKSRHIVEFGYKPHLADFEIEFKTKVQPAFNRQFDLLIKDLKSA